MSSPLGRFSSNPFDHLPSDVLVLVYQRLGLSDLSSLGRTSSTNAELHETLSLPTYLNRAHPLHRQLSLSPPLSSNTWSPSALAQHLHLSSQRLSRREFIARPLPLPSSPFKMKRVAALRPLLAVGRTRVIVGGVGGRRGSLVVYDFEQRREGEGRGELVIGIGWEVGFGAGVGVVEDGGSGGRLGWERRERRDVEGESSSTGTGGLLSGDLTGLEFLRSSCSTEGEGGDESCLILTFANGLVQSVQLPPRPDPDTSSTASPPLPPTRSKKNRRRPATATAPTITFLPLLTLLYTYPHPPSPIQSLSIPSLSPSSHHHHASSSSSPLFLTSSYSSLLTLHSSSSSSSTILTLPSSLTPWSTLLLSSHPSPSLLVGTATSLLYYDLPLSLHSPEPRSLLSKDNTSATYALHAHPFHPNLLLSAHSHPVASVLMHDLRLGGATTEVGSFSDPWTEESWYSVGMTEDGRTVLGGTGGGGRVGVWDVRMSGSGKGGGRGGWTCFAPSVAEGEGRRGGGGRGGEVGRLVVKGGRVWGVTPSSPFLLDFSSTSNLAPLYPPLPPSPSSAPTTQRDYGGGGEGVVSWYEHQGEKVVLGSSQRVG